jgi:hypothetical protein
VFARVTFLFVLAFWLVMNVLLWRSIHSGHQAIGNKVPAALVWKKIITAPDNSSLEILHYNERIGFCNWAVQAGATPIVTGKESSDEYLPEELTKTLTSYTLTLDGRASFSSNDVVHMNASLRLSTNENWQEFHAHVNLRPNTWELSANSVQQRLKLQVTDDGGTWQRTFKFADLQDPEKLIQDLGIDSSFGMIGALIPGGKNGLASLASSVKWDAYADTMQFGHSRVGVYRLETHVFGQKIFIFVSKVGEILWVELPDKIVFRNEAFAHF